jgi:hypothetical protein
MVVIVGVADRGAPGSARVESPDISSRPRGDQLGFDQYHEPPEELSAEARTFARMIVSLQEEAEAISWYDQRIAVETDDQARAIMQNAQQEEFKHFAMDLEFLLRRTPKWKAAMEKVLFTEGDIVGLGEEAEEAADDAPDS